MYCVIMVADLWNESIVFETNLFCGLEGCSTQTEYKPTCCSSTSLVSSDDEVFFCPIIFEQVLVAEVPTVASSKYTIFLTYFLL